MGRKGYGVYGVLVSIKMMHANLIWSHSQALLHSLFRKFKLGRARGVCVETFTGTAKLYSSLSI